MFSATDNDRLQQIMEQNPEIKSLVTRLLKSHRLEISTISHEKTSTTPVRNAVTTWESQSRMPTFAKIEVAPAKPAEARAYTIHMCDHSMGLFSNVAKV